MPETSTHKLLDFEGNIEDNVASFLLGLGFAQVFTPRTKITEEALAETPRAHVSLEIQSTGEQVIFLPGSGREFDSEKNARLSISVVTRRNDGAGMTMGELRGRIRDALTVSNTALSYQWYSFTHLRETASNQTVAAENDEIATTLDFDLKFFVRYEGFTT